MFSRNSRVWRLNKVGLTAKYAKEGEILTAEIAKSAEELAKVAFQRKMGLAMRLGYDWHQKTGGSAS